MMPQRLTHSRSKGWRLPEGAAYVGRPTVFGNPFAVAEYGHQGAVDLFRQWLASTLVNGDRLNRSDARAARFSERYLSLEALRAEILARVPELRGRTLSCWCKAGLPCHADVLLELANR